MLLFLSLALLQSYSIEDLGTLSSDPNDLVEAAAVDDHGHAAATVLDTTSFPFRERAFFWDDGLRTEILPASGWEARAEDLNDDDLVVGGIDQGSLLASRSFTWQAGVTTEFQVGSLSFSSALGVNQDGWLSGRYQYATDPFTGLPIQDAYVRSPGGNDVLLAPLGSEGSEAVALNDFGVAVGWSTLYGVAGRIHAAVWTAPNPTPVDIDPNFGPRSYATDVDAWDRVVGGMADAQGNVQPFVWEAGAVTLLPTLGGAEGAVEAVADSGALVGWAEDANGVRRACSWEGGAPVALDALIAPGSGWTLTTATDVNELGEIVGNGTLNGMPRAWKLTPVLAAPRISGLVPPAAGRTDRCFGLGFPPGATVHLVGSLQAGSTAVPGCAGLVVDLAAPTVVATPTADADGRLEVALSPPASLAGATVHLQAVDLAACVVSDPVTHALR